MPIRLKSSQAEPTAIDLFSGCGGLSVGLAKAGFRVQAAVELDTKAAATYKLNHPHVRLYELDIRKLKVSAILRDLKLKPGGLDLLAGCPPCQGYSRLRTRNGGAIIDDPRNDLIDDFLRFVRVLRPKSIMLENVPALMTDARFELFCSALESLRYQCVFRVLDAADYLVPQRRKRLILIASRTHAPSLAAKRGKKKTVRQALKGLKSPARAKDRLHAVPENRSEAVRTIIRLVPRNGGSRSDLPAKYRLKCHERNDGFYDIYGRMAWDAPSPTITSGCINPSKGRFLHPAQHRTITLREAAILQGFPRRYKFDVSHGKEAIAAMIGNALPPPFIAAHARTLRDGMFTKRGATRARKA